MPSKFLNILFDLMVWGPTGSIVHMGIIVCIGQSLVEPYSWISSFDLELLFTWFSWWYRNLIIYFINTYVHCIE